MDKIMRNKKADDRSMISGARLKQIKALEVDLRKALNLMGSMIPLDQWVAIKPRSKSEIELYNVVASGLLENYKEIKNEARKLLPH